MIRNSHFLQRHMLTNLYYSWVKFCVDASRQKPTMPLPASGLLKNTKNAYNK